MAGDANSANRAVWRLGTKSGMTPITSQRGALAIRFCKIRMNIAGEAHERHRDVLSRRHGSVDPSIAGVGVDAVALRPDAYSW